VLRASVDAEDERVASLAVHLADDQPARRAGVGGERRHAGGVADDADAAAARQCLALEELGGVEELLAAREPEDPGVLQERVDRVVAAQRRRAVGLRLVAPAGWEPPAFDGEDRLAPRDALRDAREALGVPERLHVEHHRGRPGVLLPQLQQVVRRDVRAIAERREARAAEPPARRVPEQHDADGAGLRADREAAAATLAPANVALRLTAESVLRTPRRGAASPSSATANATSAAPGSRRTS
jgi:hypothetical protein